MPYLTTKYTNLPEIAGKEREMTPFDGVLFGAPFSEEHCDILLLRFCIITN